MSNITGEEGSFSSGNTGEEVHQEKKQQLQNHCHGSTISLLPNSTTTATDTNGSSSQQQQQQPSLKKKRNLPGTPGNYSSPPTYQISSMFLILIYKKIHPSIVVITSFLFFFKIRTYWLYIIYICIWVSPKKISCYYIYMIKLTCQAGFI